MYSNHCITTLNAFLTLWSYFSSVDTFQLKIVSRNVSEDLNHRKYYLFLCTAYLEPYFFGPKLNNALNLCVNLHVRHTNLYLKMGKQLLMWKAITPSSRVRTRILWIAFLCLTEDSRVPVSCWNVLHCYFLWRFCDKKSRDFWFGDSSALMSILIHSHKGTWKRPEILF